MTIPNNDVAFQAHPQSLLFQTTVDSWMNGIKSTGLLIGCAVTAQGSPNMTVAVTSGSTIHVGRRKSPTSGNVTIGAQHATLDRIDCVVIASDGSKAVRAGTA